ncbi:acetamidase/formamidase family protein [Brachybacterium sp. J153]|uniref:acetamidase/formamidase family protein n=1 Tax=Brachybacterium sp. J153 TaxID=3116488 RepID=UPI002E793B23|nr:acetamidase/formamidase family protein [Brachybacterium sp. J153]MEE1619622.1 acetamidase/formamidase family protein [Brachybacterium sp. J153]
MSTDILRPGGDPTTGVAHLPVEESTSLWGRLPCAADAPVLRLDPGDEVVVDTLSHEGILEDQGRDPVAFFAAHGVDPEQVLPDAIALAAGHPGRDPRRDGPHVVTGPIHVAGALPGDLLRITILEHTPRVPYGVVSNRHGRGALPGEYPRGEGSVSIFAGVEETGDGLVGTMAPRAGAERTIRFPLRPFLGIMGVAVPGAERPHSVPPGPHGGNIDLNLLTAGSSLYLPVQVEGALAYVGDPHFAQGDGEVALTAMEASLRSRLRLDVIPREEAVEQFGEVVGPLAETAEHLVPTGMDEDLDRAVQDCVRQAIALLQARWGLDPEHAYAYLSAATDFDISQVVDVVKGVHARIRTADLAEVRR